MHLRSGSLLAFSCLFFAACPPGDAGGGTTSTDKTTTLTIPGVDLTLTLPDDGAGTWVVVDTRADGSFGRTTKDGTHTTSLKRLTSSSCDTALASAKQGATSQGKQMDAADRPAWLPPRYWPVAMTAMDTDGTGAETAVWLACLDTKNGPLGAVTTVTAALGAKHEASHADVKLALDRAADAALAAAQASSTSSPSTAPATPTPLPPG